jgi:hypothetical protein
MNLGDAGLIPANGMDRLAVVLLMVVGLTMAAVVAWLAVRAVRVREESVRRLREADAELRMHSERCPEGA